MAHTGQCEELVANKDGRLVLVFVQSILSPVAQELFHGNREAWVGGESRSSKAGSVIQNNLMEL